MEIYETQSEIAKRKNWPLSLIVVVLVATGILLILQSLAFAVTPYLFGVSIQDIVGLMSGDFSTPNGRMAIFFIQGIGSGIGFWLAAYVIARFIDKADFHWEIQFPRFNLTGAGLVILITFGGMLFNALLVYWNSFLVLPEFLSGLELWMKETEEQLLELTKFLTDFQSIPELLAAILVIGVLAGVGEELFFRGVVQPKMKLYTGSAHAGVWLTAIIFSAIHLQFYGFLPRVFLGALFGYLYLYSGCLIYPIFAHILNNSITVILVYLVNQELIDIDLESTDAVSYPAAILGLLSLLAGIYYFKKINRPNGELDKSI
jgi:hypothetical protein